jgi:hypothetical protein
MVVHSDSVWPWVWLLVWLSTRFCVQVCVVQVNSDGTDIMEMHANVCKEKQSDRNSDPTRLT